MGVKIVIPLVPAVVNNYVRHTRSGRHYKTALAKSFEEIGAVACRGIRVDGNAYRVGIWIFQGKGNRGDIDNYAKQPLDLLVNCGVIDSDAKVVELYMRKEKDHKNPRTEICVEAL